MTDILADLVVTGRIHEPTRKAAAKAATKIFATGFSMGMMTTVGLGERHRSGLWTSRRNYDSTGRGRKAEKIHVQRCQGISTVPRTPGCRVTHAGGNGDDEWVRRRFDENP